MSSPLLCLHFTTKAVSEKGYNKDSLLKNISIHAEISGNIVYNKSQGDNMSMLDEARKQINEIDAQMAELFEQRMHAVEDVIAYKQEHQMPVLDSGREKAVIERNQELIQDERYKESYRQFITHVMEVSRAYQKKVLNQDVVAYGGARGAFSHIAAMKCFPQCELRNYPTFEEVFQAVVNADAAYGVIPFENSYTGEVGDMLDMLLEYDVSIQYMYDLKICQNLLGVPGASLEDIRQVYSHPQALAQSSLFLQGRGLDLIPYGNTALAAQYVAETKDPSKAAIASIETAELYGLNVLVRDINTSSQNATRFVIIAKTPKESGNRCRLLFTVRHETGALMQVMQLMAKYGMNLESIKSRSLHDQPWAYYFYCEIVGDIHSAEAAHLLEEMKRECAMVKVVGIYDRKESEETV